MSQTREQYKAALSALTFYQYTQMALGNDDHACEWWSNEQTTLARYDLASAILRGEL